MKKAYEMVSEFHRAFGVSTPDIPTIPSEEIVKLRISLMMEELTEYVYAVDFGDMVNIADSLADLAYVVIGTAAVHGLNRFDEIFAEVHRSNMSKLDGNGKPIYRQDGKILKGNGFSEPQLDLFIAED